MVIKKRGISDVVSTVLIILLVVAAVAIVGAIIIKTTSKAAPQVSGSVNCQMIDVNPTHCDYTSATAAGDGYFIFKSKINDPTSLVGLKLIIENADGSTTPVDVSPSGMGSLETNSYLPSYVAGKTPSKFSLVASLRDSTGAVKLCSQTRKIDCTSNSAPNPADTVTVGVVGAGFGKLTTPVTRGGGGLFTLDVILNNGLIGETVTITSDVGGLSLSSTNTGPTPPPVSDQATFGPGTPVTFTITTAPSGFDFSDFGVISPNGVCVLQGSMPPYAQCIVTMDSDKTVQFDGT